MNGIVERLRAYAEHGFASDHKTDCVEAADHIERLEAALRPFADAAEDIDDNNRDRWEMWEHPAAMSIHVSDMRRAREALAALPPTKQGEPG